jgi:hypothetical protein
LHGGRHWRGTGEALCCWRAHGADLPELFPCRHIPTGETEPRGTAPGFGDPAHARSPSFLLATRLQPGACRHRHRTTTLHDCAPLPQSLCVEGCPTLNGFARRSTMLSLCCTAMVANTPRCHCVCRADPQLTVTPRCSCRTAAGFTHATSTSRSRLTGPDSMLELTLLFRVPLSHSKTSTPCMSSMHCRHDHLPVPLPHCEKERATPAPRLGARCWCTSYGVYGCRQGSARGCDAPTFLAYI